ncbi:MAG: GntR family transcriptional regulator [Clostridia bacterium]|nr:GntR family transcriptional regulator [Clostridia bacterium]MDD4679364.1 GntR family transcriptional regulator [Clostridia bacterium]
MISKLKEKKPMSLAQWAYISIKDYIINNNLEPGSQLNIEELTLELNISRTPVREALIRLKQEGIVTSMPRVGFFVSGITKKEFDDLFELRLLVECYVAEQAAKRMSDKTLESLEKTLERSNLLVQEGKTKEFNQLEIIFHNTIIESLHNNRISAVMNSVEDLLYKERLIAIGSLENVKQSVVEHEKILKAIQNRDFVLSNRAMEEHLLNVKIRLEKILDFQDSESQ